MLGTTMGSPDAFRAMLALFTAGGPHPVVDNVFPLAKAGAARRRMDEAAQFGTIVVRIG